jgi:bla regulator protein blaR1
MIASLMMYGIAIAALVGLAALTIEHSLVVLKRPRRMVWALSLVSSLALPAAMILANNLPGPGFSTQSARHLDFVAGAPLDHPILPLPAISFVTVQPSWALRPDLGRLLKAAWLVSSLGTLAFYAIGWVSLRSAARKWQRDHVDGSTVFIADRLGPAVVGFLKPRIILPRWLLDDSPARRTMAVAHEQAHIAARDPLLVLGAMLLIALTPWNIPLLWQLRRLRFAIEVDCDSRVLRGGITPSAYGEMLLTVGQRNAEMPAIAVALTEPASQLERRVRVMMSRAYRHAKLVAVACICASVLPVVAGAQLRTPTNSPSTQGAGMIGTEMKHYKSSEWGFDLDIPQRWNSFPAVPTNSPNEVIRFASHEDGRHVLIVFRNPYDSKEDPSSYRDRIQEILAKDGFSDFVHSDIKIGTQVFKVLDADKILNGHSWSIRQFYIVDGTLVHVLGFGTTNAIGA